MGHSDATEETLNEILGEIKEASTERLRENLELFLDPDKEEFWLFVELEDPGYANWWIENLSKELRSRGEL